ncbi:efflux RND transporter periplasmic adaptor subunit [Lacimicrobium alkaliphilum]|uniref:RND transporter n=1 Tax=Lacimicrobium alkaliphilum TaxID=1526571 RepID=A0A0U2ZAA8_9ALTE|nr:HlyD family efflux transporter periplasmic adaptor subunit [Lacimicrobium alkaliphilum]ALS99412.1 RND transporter [Lacimicrobium alkaliphilum]
MPPTGSRFWLTTTVLIVLVLLLGYALWPQAIQVDVAEARLEAMQLTIDEEGRTRVRDAYMVAAPVAGRLLRVEKEPGDAVVADETIIARLLPLSPALLDIRTREQGLAAVSSAQAAIRMAKADLNRAQADRELAEAESQRTQKLFDKGLSTQAELDAAIRTARSAAAALDTANAALAVREAELDAARARLIDIRDADGPVATGQHQKVIEIRAPESGKVLQILQKSETTVSAGTPIMEIGDTDNDLEIIAELLSTDAVRVSPGDPVIIDNWGGTRAIDGTVKRVEPWGFTKYSALGVEEQRVNTIIRINENARQHQLGHGYRVECRIVVWQDPSVLTVPSSALFRHNTDWAVFVKQRNKVTLTVVKVGHNNGIRAQILTGLEPGEKVVLYPGPELQDGAAVTERTD